MTLRAYRGGSILAEHRPGPDRASAAGGQSGDVPPVLALHGWGRDRRDLLESLAGFEVLAVDLPGFGASPPPPEGWGAAEYAAAVAEMTAEAGGGPHVAVGHSFGGRVAVCMAVDHPDLVSGVVLAGVPLWRSGPVPRPALSYRAVRALARLGLVGPGRLEAARRRHGSSDYRAAGPVMREVLVRVVSEDYRDRLARIRQPAALVWGEHDDAAPAQIAVEAACILPRPVTVDIVEDAGHDIHRDAPESIARAVEAVVRAGPEPVPGW